MIRFKPHCGNYDPSKDSYVETIEDFWNIEFIQSFKNISKFHIYAYSDIKDNRFTLMSLSKYNIVNNKCDYWW